MIHRLRSAEAVKLSVLQHDLDTLRDDAMCIDRFHGAFVKHCPSTVFDSSEQASQFIGVYPELSAEADRLMSKPLKATIDVTPEDFER